MSNKTQLQQNNTELQAHLQDILGLPTAAEIAAGASTGQYMWKKYEYEPDSVIQLENPTIDITATWSNNKDSFEITDSSFNETLLQYITPEFYDGFTSSIAVGSAHNKFIMINNALHYYNYFDTSDPSQKNDYTVVLVGVSKGYIAVVRNVIDTATYSFDGIKSIKKSGFKNLIGYVVSDSPTAYPNNGVQDGFWYERIDKLQKGLNILERREDGSARKICLNYDGETLDRYNGLGDGLGSKTICSAEEVEIIADTLNDDASGGSILFYINSVSEHKKVKLKIKDALNMLFSSATIQYAKKLWVSNMTSITINSGTYRYGLGSSETETIYAEPNSKPSGWDSRWNYYGTSKYNTVVWGVSEEQFDAM
ncbi:hypothetical protein AALA24_02055 [Anaerovoracaceae bacterium 42-11]